MACSHLALQLGLKSSKEVIPWESHQHEKKTSLLLFYVPLFPSLAYAQKDIQEEVEGSNPIEVKRIFLFLRCSTNTQRDIHITSEFTLLLQQCCITQHCVCNCTFIQNGQAGSHYLNQCQPRSLVFLFVLVTPLLMIEPTLLENCRHQAVAVLDQMYIPTFQGMFVA